MIETFGFFSGFVGYYRKRLIDFRGSLQFIAVSVPVAVLGAVVLLMIDQRSLLKGAYAALMLVVAVIMPQLVKRNRVPVPVAAATSVFIVIVTVASASFTQISGLIAEGASTRSRGISSSIRSPE